MMSVSDLVQQKSRGFDIPIGKPRDNQERSAEWEHAKDIVDEQQANIEKAVQDLLEKKVKVSSSLLGKCQKKEGIKECGRTLKRFQFEIEEHPYIIELLVYECEIHDMRAAEYVTFDDKTNMCYCRRIIRYGDAV